MKSGQSDVEMEGGDSEISQHLNNSRSLGSHLSGAFYTYMFGSRTEDKEEIKNV